MNFNIVGINHIGLAPKIRNKQNFFFRGPGLLKGKRKVKDQKVNTLCSPQIIIKKSNLEILIPPMRQVLFKFLDKR